MIEALAALIIPIVLLVAALGVGVHVVAGTLGIIKVGHIARVIRSFMRVIARSVGFGWRALRWLLSGYLGRPEHVRRMPSSRMERREP